MSKAIVLGGLLSLANLALLWALMTRLMTQGGKKARFVAFGFFLKEVGLMAVLWVALSKLGSHPVGLLVGFGVPLMACILYGIFEGFHKA